jgi:nitrogen-specific signal transduction histidine kinase
MPFFRCPVFIESRPSGYVEATQPDVPEECRDEVPEPGYCAAEEGAGFGLAIVAEIVKELLEMV